MKSRKADERSWMALVCCAALPAALGIALAAVTVLVGCKRRQPEPEKWIGVDRSRVSCGYDGGAYQYSQATCVGDGRAYKCVREDGTWRCAELATKPAPVELPGR